MSKKSSVTAKKPVGDNFGKFVSCSLSEEDKAHVKEHLLGSSDILDKLEDLCREGYKISVSFDERSDAVGAFMTRVSQGDPHTGWTLTARAPFAVAALTVLLYKHFEMLKEDWTTAMAGGQRDGWG